MANSYELIVENINIESMDDLKAAINKTMSLSNGNDDHMIRIHYTGLFFGEATETLSVEHVTDRIIGYFETNYHRVENPSVVDVTNKYSLKSNKAEMFIDTCSIVKVLASERDAIIEDIVKNSAI